MLLPQTKEREYRFKLALRMGLPVFALIIALVSHTLIENYTILQPSFYVESILLLVFSIYFILYLIYNGFDVKITDDVSKTFTREYLFKYLNKELKKNSEYSLVLISIDNLNDINTQYGIENGDKILQKSAELIAKYYKNKNIENFPLGHIYGGNFILGLPALENESAIILELFCLKSNELTIDDIEIKLSGAICDTSYSKELHYMIEHLFNLQEERRNSKENSDNLQINPNELEHLIIDALNNRSISVMSQNVYENGSVSFVECYTKLIAHNKKPLYPKSYMKILNKLGLTIEYDLMVLEQIVLQLKTQKKAQYALNISATSLRNEKFLRETKELLKNSHVQFMFIVSEAEYFAYTSKFNTIIQSLKNVGVSIVIDRLGSIHSSFLYLRELKIDFVRFDTYYSHKEKLLENRAIIDGFNLMAHEKGVKSWIKNIEDEATLSLVQELEVDCIQGKYLSALEPRF